MEHPLNRRHPVRSLARFVAWQVRSRAASAPIPVKFVDGTKLLVSRGQTGATGNVYTGLHEFSEMAFVLHVLRPADLFVDVGANVGSYTILAAGAVGAECVAFEPDPDTMTALARNVAANGLENRVDLRQSVVGSSQGTAMFTKGGDTLNHVAANDDEAARGIPMTTLDVALGGRSAQVLKIDVEGYEREVLSGSSATLSDPRMIAVIMETNGSGSRYGSSDADLHAIMTKHGFMPCSYEPFERRITVHSHYLDGGNTIYLKDFAAADARVTSAPTYDVAGRARI